MDNKGEQDKIADGDEENQSKYGTSIMPNAPGLYSLVQTPQYYPSVQHIAARCDKSE
jgi:hypothetical protein